MQSLTVKYHISFYMITFRPVKYLGLRTLTLKNNFHIKCQLLDEQFSKSKGRHKRESKNAKQMRNTKQNCFSHSSASPRNDKQCSAKQCFANQTNRCLAGFASRSDLFRDNARLTKIVEKLISDISFCKLCTQPCDLR